LNLYAFVLNLRFSIVFQSLNTGSDVVTVRAVEPNLKFQSPTLGIRNFWFQFRLQHLEVFGSCSRMIWSIGNGKLLYYLYNSLALQTRLWNRNRNFRLRLRLHHLKFIGSGSSHPKLLRTHSPGCSSLLQRNTWVPPHFPDLFHVWT